MDPFAGSIAFNYFIGFVLICIIFETVESGWELARNKDATLEGHRFRANVVIPSLVALIVLSVKISPLIFHRRLHTPLALHLRYIHLLYFVSPFTLLFLAIRFGISGEKFPRLHKFIAYPCAFFGVGTVIMGMVLDGLLAAGQ